MFHQTNLISIKIIRVLHLLIISSSVNIYGDQDQRLRYIYTISINIYPLSLPIPSYNAFVNFQMKLYCKCFRTSNKNPRNSVVFVITSYFTAS